jgi:N4-gp56 family major capsid protein
MPTEPNLQTTGTLAPDIVGIWLRDELLERAERNLVFWDICDKTQLPRGNGQVVQFTRYEYLDLPEAPLEEGVTPALTAMKISTVQAIVDQWGAIVGITDRAEMTVKHPTMQIARDLLTDQHDQVLDREVQFVANGTTGVAFAGGKASRSAITAADVLRTDDIRKQVATLRSQGARTFELAAFKGVFDPFVEGDLTKDPTFVNAGVYSDLVTLKDFEVGKWMGVRWSRSNFIPVLSQIAAADFTIAAAGTTVIPAGGVGFTAGSTVRVKITRLDPSTKFETQIGAETAVTNASIFVPTIVINSGAATATYKIYSTLENGATGTATFQLRVRFTSGTAQTITLVKGGSGLPVGSFVVVGTGSIAPPDCPSVNVHTVYIFGRGAIGATELGGLEAFFIPRRPSESDPLAQRAKASWKQIFKSLILNPDFMRRIECASDFS